MINLLSKSANGLMRNESVNLDNRMKSIQAEQRHARSDLQDIKLMLNKLLIDKHLQAQVDDYFQENPTELDDK